MPSRKTQLITSVALLALAASAAGLEELDLKLYRGRPKPADAAVIRDEPLDGADPVRVAVGKRGEPVETVDTGSWTPPRPNEVTNNGENTNPAVMTLTGTYTADTSFSQNTATTVHTGGVGQPTSTTGGKESTTSGVLGPNTTGSMPSGGNVVPSGSAAATGSGASATGSETTAGGSAGSGASGATASGTVSASKSDAGSATTAAATTTTSVLASSGGASSAGSAGSTNQSGATQARSTAGAAMDNIVEANMLGVVGLLVGWLL